MSSTVIVCSSCNRQLTVPAEVMGKKVKCPLCHEIFTAPQPAGSLPPVPSLEISDSDRDKVASQPILPPKVPTWSAEEERLPSVRKPTYDDDDDRRGRGDRDRPWRGRYENDDDDFDQRRFRRRGRSDMEEAESAVAAPGICLMILGSLYALIGLVFLVIAIASRMDRDGRIVMLIFTIILVCWGGFILLGGIMMKSMRSYGLAMAASIMALLNHPCFVLHLVLGIWSIVVLSREEVRRAFRWKAGQ